MASNPARVFEDHAAARGPSPLLFGLIGPSGSGKTFSALRLATGMQRVFGGEVFVVDTESNRALHYAEKFQFRHVPFGAPFSPLDYLAAIQHCAKKGARTIIVDSMSHEHEGPGGVLEMHQNEVERMSRGDAQKAERVKMLAWARPKQERRRLINTVLQMDVNLIFCFRAKEKLKIVSGKEPQELGFMPIAGEEFVYELTAKALLLPGANGAPTWKSDFVGERMMIKLPEQFRGIFTGEAAKQLDEDTGEQLAKWAIGGSGNAFADEYLSCTSQAQYDALEKRRATMWPKTPPADKKVIKAASDAAAVRIKEPAPATVDEPTDEPPTEVVDTDTGEVVISDGPIDREFVDSYDKAAQ